MQRYILKVDSEMARISKYKNEMTDISVALAGVIQKESLKMTLQDIESKQTYFGISDAQLSDFLNIDRAVMSMHKKKGQIPKYYTISIYLLFRHLERELK
jgi:hypothetical protein